MADGASKHSSPIVRVATLTVKPVFHPSLRVTPKSTAGGVVILVIILMYVSVKQTR